MSLNAPNSENPVVPNEEQVHEYGNCRPIATSPMKSRAKSQKERNKETFDTFK